MAPLAVAFLLNLQLLLALSPSSATGLATLTIDSIQDIGNHQAARRPQHPLRAQNTELDRFRAARDPDHRVPYKNHPYEHRRRLQGELEPIRVTFYTQALEDARNASNNDKIDLLVGSLLPAAATFWSDALSLVPVSGNLVISASELVNRQYCGSTDFTSVPQEHLADGLPDTDLIIYVSASNATQHCPIGVWSSGTACNFDQFDRPTAGAINICLDQLDIENESIESLVEVLAHEFGHLLGASSVHFPFFWDSATGMPRTPRPFTLTDVTCLDTTVRSVVLPSTSTMQVFTAQNGQRYAAIVTPRVRTVARNQFNCQSLPGARLENQDDSCFGTHWEQHDYYPELMTKSTTPTRHILTPLTLALLEDSGWYKADYSVSSTSPWGLGAGCDFVEEPCLTTGGDDTVIPDYSRGYFCAEATNRGCSPSLSHKLACTIIDYAFVIPDVSPEPPYQYFPTEPTLGGQPSTDYCPVHGSSYDGLEVDELSCKDPNNAQALNIYSEVYGPDSQCIEVTSGDSRCYRTACVQPENELRINVRGEWLLCSHDFERIEVRVGAGAIPQTLICPRLSAACPEIFCPKNCEASGICNFGIDGNGNANPQCEPLPPTDIPTLAPTAAAEGPSQTPSATTASENPTSAPTASSPAPTSGPSPVPTGFPRERPSPNPTTVASTDTPNITPPESTNSPTGTPNPPLTGAPTESLPTQAPSTTSPDATPSSHPSNNTSGTAAPSFIPSDMPSLLPSHLGGDPVPSMIPSDGPSLVPSDRPTSVNSSPSISPSNARTDAPSEGNSATATSRPTAEPTDPSPDESSSKKAGHVLTLGAFLLTLFVSC